MKARAHSRPNPVPPQDPTPSPARSQRRRPHRPPSRRAPRPARSHPRPPNPRRPHPRSRPKRRRPRPTSPRPSARPNPRPLNSSRLRGNRPPPLTRRRRTRRPDATEGMSADGRMALGSQGLCENLLCARRFVAFRGVSSKRGCASLCPLTRALHANVGVPRKSSSSCYPTRTSGGVRLGPLLHGGPQQAIRSYGISLRRSGVCRQVNRHPDISGGSLSCGNGAFGNIRAAMTAIMPGVRIIFIIIRSSMDSSRSSGSGRIRRFIVTFCSVCIHATGRAVLWRRPKAVMAIRTNNPRAHRAPYACSMAEHESQASSCSATGVT